MTDQNWKDEYYDNYNFVVKPGTPDHDERVCEFTLEDHIQQAKAWRACTFDRYGTDGALTERHYEMMDDDIRDMEEELANRDFNEAFDQLSDDEALYTARSWLINLTANDNEIARKMGFDDEQIEQFRASIAQFDTACEDEKKAIWNEQKDRVNKASTDLLNKLGPSSKPFIFTPIKKPGDADTN